MAKYLPLMFQHGMSRYWVPTTSPTADFDLPDGKGAKIRNDYYTLLTDLYVEHHLAPFQRWAEKYGMQYKAQAAYGQDLEPIRSNRELARMGGRVEGESYNSGTGSRPTSTTTAGASPSTGSGRWPEEPIRAVPIASLPNSAHSRSTPAGSTSATTRQ
ncbi:hypothetical protein NKH18_43855 [Streptomyces sp. M10(2022)]